MKKHLQICKQVFSLQMHQFFFPGSSLTVNRKEKPNTPADLLEKNASVCICVNIQIRVHPKLRILKPFCVVGFSSCRPSCPRKACVWSAAWAVNQCRIPLQCWKSQRKRHFSDFKEYYSMWNFLRATGKKKILLLWLLYKGWDSESHTLKIVFHII